MGKKTGAGPRAWGRREMKRLRRERGTTSQTQNRKDKEMYNGKLGNLRGKQKYRFGTTREQQPIHW
jgi:hypothetical protein